QVHVRVLDVGWIFPKPKKLAGMGGRTRHCRRWAVPSSPDRGYPQLHRDPSWGVHRGGNPVTLLPRCSLTEPQGGGSMWQASDDDWEDPLTELEALELRRRYRGSAIGTRDVPQHVWESPAEREFATAVGKYLSDRVEMKPGSNARTAIGTFR